MMTVERKRGGGSRRQRRKEEEKAVENWVCVRVTVTGRNKIDGIGGCAHGRPERSEEEPLGLGRDWEGAR